MKQAVILAGGKGTRLKERLGGLPKPMVDICGKPLIERQIFLLKQYGFTKIIILVNYASEKIIEYCAQNNNWGIDIKCIDDGEPLGTAGATIKILEFLESDFLVMYGDTMLDVDLDKFYDFHKSVIGTSATLFLHPNDHPADSDLVEIDSEERIIDFHPYPHNPDKNYFNLVNAALYWINKPSLNKWANNNVYLDFGKDIFPLMLNMGLCLRGYRSIEYIKDCGTPKRLDKVSKDFVSGKIQRSQLSQKGRAIFLDRDGTINEEVNHLSDSKLFKLIPNSAEAIKIFNLNEFRTCVITNQPIIARGDCSMEELSEIHKKMDTLIGQKGAYIDRLYYCPHHPDSGFEGEVKKYKIKCECRKPEVGMVLRAANDLNIDLSKSWLIGDTTTDLLTARNAGVKSILVETGYAGLDSKHLISPDFVCSDLFNAAKFITNDYELIYRYIEVLFPRFEKGSILKVGGFSRSGKTTFTNVLKYYLREKGYSVHVISIDRWIKNLNERSETVLGRYFLNEIKLFMDLVSSLKEDEVQIKLPYYNRIDNQNIKDFEEIIISKDDIIIIEGTIVFEIESIVNSIDVFVTRNEEDRKKAVINEYILRGFDLQNAVKVYEDRYIDEVPFIEKKTYLNASAKLINLETVVTKLENNGN
jgi:histidinol-phosphate phosphatase family protein